MNRIFTATGPTIVIKLLFMILLFGLIVVMDGYSLQSVRFSFTRPLMGTEVNIVLYAVDSLEATRVADNAFVRIEALNRSLSDYLYESELNRLSETHDQWVRVSDDLWNVLFSAQKIARLSDGTFDASVGPLTHLWRQAMERNSLPDVTALQQARSVVGYEFVHMNEVDQTVRLKKKNMRLDLGGIAKGYVADQALNVLAQEGIASAAVDVGGDIALGEPPPNTDGWNIQVFEEEPNNIVLFNCGIAVSGDTYQYLLVHGKQYSHIVDPKTGYGVTHRRKVAVIAPSAMIADAWASTYSVMEWGSIVSSVQTQNQLSIHIVEMEKDLQTGRFRRND